MNKIETGKYYHVFTRAHGAEILFKNEENYRFFLRKYQRYITPVCETFAYCLIYNHLHLLVRIKDAKDIAINPKYKHTDDLDKYVTKQFSNLFSSYTQSFNKLNTRMGGLFMSPYKRKVVEDGIYFLNLVKYIHLNPVEAKQCKHPKDWKHSSYNAIISKGVTLLMRDELIDHFGDLKNFIYEHEKGLT